MHQFYSSVLGFLIVSFFTIIWMNIYANVAVFRDSKNPSNQITNILFVNKTIIFILIDPLQKFTVNCLKSSKLFAFLLKLINFLLQFICKFLNYIFALWLKIDIGFCAISFVYLCYVILYFPSKCIEYSKTCDFTKTTLDSIIYYLSKLPESFYNKNEFFAFLNSSFFGLPILPIIFLPYLVTLSILLLSVIFNLFTYTYNNSYTEYKLYIEEEARKKKQIAEEVEALKKRRAEEEEALKRKEKKEAYDLNSTLMIRLKDLFLRQSMLYYFEARNQFEDLEKGIVDCLNLKIEAIKYFDNNINGSNAENNILEIEKLKNKFDTQISEVAKSGEAEYYRWEKVVNTKKSINNLSFVEFKEFVNDIYNDHKAKLIRADVEETILRFELLINYFNHNEETLKSIFRYFKKKSGFEISDWIKVFELECDNYLTVKTLNTISISNIDKYCLVCRNQYLKTLSESKFGTISKIITDFSGFLKTKNSGYDEFIYNNWQKEGFCVYYFSLLAIKSVKNLDNGLFEIIFDIPKGLSLEKIQSDKSKINSFCRNMPFVSVRANNENKDQAIFTFGEEIDSAKAKIENSIERLDLSIKQNPITFKIINKIHTAILSENSNKGFRDSSEFLLLTKATISDDSEQLVLEYQIPDTFHIEKVETFFEKVKPLIRENHLKNKYNQKKHIVTIFFQIIDKDSSFVTSVLKAEDIGVNGSFIVPIGADIASKKPVILDYSKPSIAHTLIVGSSGSGKTDFVHCFLYNLIKNNSPEQIQILMIDCLTQNYNRYDDDNPYFYSNIIKQEHILSIIEKLKREIVARGQRIDSEGCANVPEWNTKFPENPIPILFIFIEEWNSTMNILNEVFELKINLGEQFKKFIKYMNRVGRNYGFKMVYISQEIYDLNLIQKQCQYKISLFMNEEDDYKEVLKLKPANFYKKSDFVGYLTNEDRVLETFKTAILGNDSLTKRQKITDLILSKNIK